MKTICIRIQLPIRCFWLTIYVLSKNPFKHLCFRMFYFDNTLDISGWTLIAKLELSKLGTGVQFRDLNDQNGVYEYLRPGLPGINWSGFNWLEQNWISDQDGMGESLTRMYQWIFNLDGSKWTFIRIYCLGKFLTEIYWTVLWQYNQSLHWLRVLLCYRIG